MLPARMFKGFVVEVFFGNEGAFSLFLVFYFLAGFLFQSSIEHQIVLPQHHEHSFVFLLEDDVVATGEVFLAEVLIIPFSADVIFPTFGDHFHDVLLQELPIAPDRHFSFILLLARVQRGL